MNQVSLLVVLVILTCCTWTGTHASGWGRWGAWSACSATCGPGQARRHRICGGFWCLTRQPQVVTKQCFVRSCLDSCDRWTACSETCGNGRKTRRNCLSGRLETTSCHVRSCSGVSPIFPAQTACADDFLTKYRRQNEPCCNRNELPRSSCGVSTHRADRTTPSSVGIFGFYNIYSQSREQVAASEGDNLQKMFPWTVLLKAELEVCGGALIDSKWIVTAAKCLYRKRPTSVTARLGGVRSYNYWSKDGRDVQILGARRIVIHPGYNKDSFNDYNIALVELTSHVRTSSDFVSPICMPQNEILPFDSKCVIPDFYEVYRGRRDYLMQTSDMRVVQMRDCQQSYKGFLFGFTPALQTLSAERMVCAGRVDGGQNSCKGTVGAPLMCQRCSSCQWMLYGVTSQEDSRCSIISRPGVYTKTSAFEGWIRSVTGMGSQQLATHPSCQ